MRPLTVRAVSVTPASRWPQRRVASRHSRRPFSRLSNRDGTTIVELAVILPVFTVFLAGLMEINHAYLVIATLKGAANKAARLGVADGSSTAEVSDKALEVIGAAINTSNVTVYVKDASVFDAPGFDPSGIDYNGLPSIALADAQPRQLFIVRVEVPYNDVALLPPFFIKNATLSGQSVVRHE